MIARLAALLAICTGPAYGQVFVDGSKDAIPADQIIEVTRLAGNDLRDPLSAQYRNIRPAPKHQNMVCGEMNAKNAYGGYVGFVPFYVDLTRREVTVLYPRQRNEGTASYELRRIVVEIVGCLPPRKAGP